MPIIASVTLSTSVVLAFSTALTHMLEADHVRFHRIVEVRFGFLVYACHFLMNSVLAGLFDAHEVVPGGEMADQRLGVDAGELFFTHREGHDRNVFGRDLLVAELLVERHVGIAVDGRDDAAVGHLAAWNYFESIKNPGNNAFIKAWKAYTRNPKRTNDPMEAHVIGFNMWVKAVEKVKTTDVNKVIDAMIGIEAPNLTGGVAKMLPNHHLTKPVFIGEVRADGQFDVVWKTAGLVPGDAWSDFLPGSKDIEADWVTLKCGNYNTKTKTCSGQNYK